MLWRELTGIAYCRKGDMTSAVQCFRRSRSQGQGPSAEELTDMVINEREIENRSQAEQLCRIGIELEPNHGPLHFQLGELLWTRWAVREARDCLRRSNKLCGEPTVDDLIRLGDEEPPFSYPLNYNARLVAYRLATDLDPKCAIAYRRIGDLHRAYGAKEKAIESYQIAADLGCEESHDAAGAIERQLSRQRLAAVALVCFVVATLATLTFLNLDTVFPVVGDGIQSDKVQANPNQGPSADPGPTVAPLDPGPTVAPLDPGPTVAHSGPAPANSRYHVNSMRPISW